MDRQTITVDIAPEGYADHRLKVSQYDVGRPLGVYIKQDGADLDCSGYTAQLYLYKPDRTNIEKLCTISGNLITWDTAEQETIMAGICVAEIRIREGSHNVGTANFTIWVEESPADTSGSSHSESQSLIDMVDRAEDAAETAESSAAIAVHAKDETVAAAEAVERFDQMTAEAETLAPGSEATAEMDYTGEHPVMKFGIPAGATGPEGRQGQQGQQGIPGVSPVISVSDITGGHRVTITDAEGAHTFDVMDGSKGDTGETGPTGPAGYSPTVTVTDITGGHRVTITDAEGTHTFDVMDGQGGSGGAVSSVNGETGDVVLDGRKINVNNSEQTPTTIKDALDSYNRALNALDDKKADIIIASASGSIASFSDGADDMPLRDCVVNIEPVQSGSGDPAPDNVRPIIGWTGCNVTRIGKNLFDKDSSENVVNKYLNVNTGGLVNSGTAYDTSAYIPIKGGVEYTTSGYSVTATEVCFYDHEKVFISGFTSANHTFTAPQNAEYLRFDYKHSDLAVMQLEMGAVASDYVAYRQAQTYSISWQTEAGTVYGGTLDVTTGTLVVNAVLEKFDKINNGSITSELGLNYLGGNGSVSTIGDFTRVSFAVNSDVNQSVYNRISSSYQHKISNMLNHNFAYSDESAHWYRNTVLYAFFPTSLVGDTVQSVVEYLTSIKDTNPFSVWLELATPQIYHLTPVEIRTLLGQNNIWADTGDVSVQYPADTKAYVDDAVPVKDVQVNGTSVVQDGVANVPQAGTNKYGVAKAGNYGVYNYNGVLRLEVANETQCKQGSDTTKAIAPSTQHNAAFYGLAKIAGADEKNSSLPAGQYTESAKSAISQMLNAPEIMSGTTPSIPAKAGVMYVCGEVATLSITAPQSGIFDVVFTSGTTPTVLTTTGITFQGTFTPEANKRYEINVLDGYALVAEWAVSA